MNKAAPGATASLEEAVGTAIKEQNHRNVGSFVDNLLDGKGTPMRAMETKPVEQKAFGIFSPFMLNLLGL